MWIDLLPTMVGGFLVDDDAPHQPTEIVGYELDDEWVSIKGKAFTFRSKREYIGVTGQSVPGVIRLRTTFGNGATVTLPTDSAPSVAHGKDPFRGSKTFSDDERQAWETRGGRPGSGRARSNDVSVAVSRPSNNTTRVPADADQMRLPAGVGPANTRCEQCAHLRATATQPRPQSHSLTLTTFHCVASSSAAPWSVRYDTCGLFKRA